MSSEAINRPPNGASYDQNAASDQDGLPRRNSLERYRPGAYFNEEREKLRRRAHFGERRLEENNGGGGHHNQRSNGRNRGGRGRGGGNRGHGGKNFNSYRNKTRDEDFDDSSNGENAEPEFIPAADPLQTSPPPIGNWADQLESPETSPIKAEVNPLVEELKTMDLRGDKPNQHYQESKSVGGVDLREKLNQQRQQRNKFGVVQGRGGVSGKNGPGRNNYHQQQQEYHHVQNNGPPPGRNYQAQNGGHKLPMPKRNTVNFDPSHVPAEMRIIAAQPNLKKYNRPYQTRDVVMVPDLFGQPEDLTIYNDLLNEIQNSGVDQEKLWQLWHNDSHLIADDKRHWKEKCPTFNYVVETMAGYFDMDVQATRFNWYRDSSEWKPFHHDAAALKEKFARTQNFTLAVSFGAEREAAFEHAKTKTVISMPQPNGSVYTFGRDVNILWRHGIPQLPPERQTKEGRISIIAWGSIQMEEV